MARQLCGRTPSCCNRTDRRIHNQFYLVSRASISATGPATSTSRQIQPDTRSITDETIVETAIVLQPRSCRAHAASQKRRPAICPDAGKLPLLRPCLAPPGTSSSSFTRWAKRRWGKVRIFQLDAAHGQHHHLQHVCGNRLKEWRGAGKPALGLLSLCSCSIGWLDDDRRLWQLPCTGTLTFGNTFLNQTRYLQNLRIWMFASSCT